MVILNHTCKLIIRYYNKSRNDHDEPAQIRDEYVDCVAFLNMWSEKPAIRTIDFPENSVGTLKTLKIEG